MENTVEELILDRLGTAGGNTGDDGLPAWLVQLTAIILPAAVDVTAAIDRLASARATAQTLSGTAAGDARRLAGLLTVALEHHLDHAGEPCPVCGGRNLDDQWAEATRAEIVRLAEVARDADAADAELRAAGQALATIVAARPSVLATAPAEGIDPRAAGEAWDRWTDLKTGDAFAARDAAVTALRRPEAGPGSVRRR